MPERQRYPLGYLVRAREHLQQNGCRATLAERAAANAHEGSAGRGGSTRSSDSAKTIMAAYAPGEYGTSSPKAREVKGRERRFWPKRHFFR